MPSLLFESVFKCTTLDENSQSSFTDGRKSLRNFEDRGTQAIPFLYVTKLTEVLNRGKINFTSILLGKWTN